jgi:hypothetical protein
MRCEVAMADEGIVRINNAIAARLTVILVLYCNQC